MAIKDDMATAAAYTAGAPIPPAAAGVPPTKTWGFFSMPASAGMSRTAASDVLVRALATLTEVYTKDISKDSQYTIDVLAVDNAKETRLNLSAVLVCARVKNTPAAGVSFHTLLLEGSGERLEDITTTLNDRQVIISRYAADVYNPTYRQTAMEIVKRAYPGLAVFDISGEVVPRSFNWEDKDAVRNLAANASYPGLSDLEMRSPDFVDINLAAWQKDANLQVKLNFNEPDRVDYAGLPVRNNISVELIATEIARAGEAGINNQDRNRKVTSLGGYIDLLWAPEATPVYGFGQQPAGPRHKFSARFVITNMENQLRMTLRSQLLALCTAVSLTEGNAWYPYYLPRHQNTGGRNVDLRDIGAINIEANINDDPSGYGLAYDTKAATFTKIDLGALLNLAVRPGLTISLDVSDLGADTWYNEAFSAAAGNNQKAAIMILQAANELTGGIFAGRYASNENPIILNEDRVHLGYYEGQDGQRHDIREIDHLAILNLTASKDPGAAQAFSDTYLRTEYPLAQRLDQRKRIIADSVPGKAVFTGMARRCTPTGKFMVALAQSCKQAGLDARLVSSASGTGYEDQRGVASFLPQTLIMPGSIGIFQPGQGNAGQAAAGYPNSGGFSGRYL